MQTCKHAHIAASLTHLLQMSKHQLFQQDREQQQEQRQDHQQQRTRKRQKREPSTTNQQLHSQQVDSSQHESNVKLSSTAAAASCMRRKEECHLCPPFCLLMCSCSVASLDFVVSAGFSARRVRDRVTTRQLHERHHFQYFHCRAVPCRQQGLPSS